MRTTVILILVLVVLGSALAGRKNRNRGQKRGCRFSRKPVTMSECVNGVMNVTRTRHPKSPDTCPESEVFTKRCRQPFCKYSRKNQVVSACNTETNTESVISQLKKAVGQIECNDTRSYERPCKMVEGCMYKDLYEYGDCDNDTGRATGAMKLKRGSQDCEERKVIKLPCHEAAMRMEKMKVWKAKKAAKKEAKRQRKANKKERKANKRKGRRGARM